MNNSIILTDDGSNSLFNNDIYESYHSKHGAINESQHVFINYGLKYNGILITYCAKGLIKRTLKKVGFQIYSFSGPKGKREITQARKI